MLYLSYSVRLKKSLAVNLNETVYWYRRAVDFYIDVCLIYWDSINSINRKEYQIKFIEERTIPANRRILTVPDEINFTQKFPGFPSYLRRVAIKQARGLVSSHQKHLNSWMTMASNKRGKRPGHPSAGEAFPYLYHRHMFQRIALYRAKIKVYNNGKWEWCDVDLCRSDANYIEKIAVMAKKKCLNWSKKGQNGFWNSRFSLRKRSCLFL